MIRKLIKWFLCLCLLIVAGLGGLLLFKDAIIRNLTEHRIIDQTGMYVRIDRMHVGFTEPVISMQDLKLYNRPEFGGGLLFHVNELHMQYDPEALRSGELHLDLLRLDLEELNIVRNAAGETNVADFIQRAGTEGRRALSRKLPAKDFGFTGIDTLDLSLGRIRLIDLGNPRRNREVHFNETNLVIRHIRNEGDLYGVAAIVLLRSGLVSLATPGGTAGRTSDGWFQLLLEWLNPVLDWLRQMLGMDHAPPGLSRPHPASDPHPSP